MFRDASGNSPSISHVKSSCPISRVNKWKSNSGDRSHSFKRRKTGKRENGEWGNQIHLRSLVIQSEKEESWGMSHGIILRTEDLVIWKANFIKGSHQKPIKGEVAEKNPAMRKSPESGYGEVTQGSNKGDVSREAVGP